MLRSDHYFGNSALVVITQVVMPQMGLEVTEATVLRVLVAVGDDIFFVANGGFGLYDERGNLRPGVTQVAPVIARLNARADRH